MNYKELKVADLRKVAEERGILNVSGMKKAELVEMLEGIDEMKKARQQGAQASQQEQQSEASQDKKQETKQNLKNTGKKQTSKSKTAKENTEKENAVKKGSVKASADKEGAAKKSSGTKDSKKAASAKQKSASKKNGENSSDKNLENNSDKNIDKNSDKNTDKNSEKNKNSDQNLENKGDKQSKADANRKSRPVVKKNQSSKNSKNFESKNKDGQQEAQKTAQNINQKESQKTAQQKDIDPKASNQMNENQMNGNQMNGNQMNGNQMNDVKESTDPLMDEENAAPQNEVAEGILEVLQEGYGFIRSDNYMPGEKDIYVSPSQIRKFRLRTGDIVKGPVRRKTAPTEKFNALLYIDSVNGYKPDEIVNRMKFEDMTPIFPNERIKLDFPGAPLSLRIVDLFSPIGKGQRGMIVSPPKAGKTTLLKQIAKRISSAYPEMNVLVLLIDERPEEVTDIKESIEGPNAEVIYSTFDELPEHHKRVSEMAIERAKRLVESGEDVVILIDSITRLSRAYNLTITPSGRTLSGGLDPAALHMPKKFFGAARNMREGGSLTILATALIDTGSRLDDVVFEEFKGTGNMELVLDRDLQEKRVFPAIDVSKSGTRKDNLLLNPEEREVLDIIHRRFHSMKPEEVTEDLLKIFAKTKDNAQFVAVAKKLFANI